MSESMRAVIITTPGPPEVMRLIQAHRPEPGPGELLVRVEAAGVNPVDLATRAGVFHGRWFSGTPQLGLGWDVSGTVAAAGAAVSGFSAGDRVMAMNDQFARPTGCYADLVTVPAAAAAHVPDGLDFVAAATIPLNGNTAAESLELLALAPGQRLLVTGAAGAVGGFAVSLAAAQGVRVTALAAAKDDDLARGFGATEVLARDTDLTGLRAFDGVLDAAMLGERAIGAVADGGAFLSVSPSVTPRAERGIRVETVKAAALGDRTAELARLAVAGVVKPRVAGTRRLADAVQAHRLAAEGTTRARWVLIP